MVLSGKKGLVVGVTNDKSIGWGIAEAAAAHGAEVGIVAQNERMLEKVQKLIEGRSEFKTFTCDLTEESQVQALREAAEAAYGKLDFLVHSVAFAKREDLSGRFLDTSRDGFLTAMDVSAYTLVSLCREMEPLLNDDGAVVTISYLGSTRAVGNYNVMGVAKAALEACVRYLAVDLGGRGIRVNTLSPGPVNTVSARGVKGLLDMIEYVQDRAPLKRTYGPTEVGGAAVYLLSDLSKGVSGQILFIDSGYNMVGL